MGPLRTRILFALLLLPTLLPAQLDSLYAIEDRVMQGDLQSLAKLGTYLDSKTHIVEFLGHHHLNPTEGEIAQRIISENTLFTPEQLALDEQLTTQEFANFLATNPVHWCDTVAAFLVTPLSHRSTDFEVRALSPQTATALRQQYSQTWDYEWLTANKIDKVVAAHDPRCLWMIAAQLFQHHSRYNRYYFEDQEFTDWLKYLTGFEVGVPNDKGEISYAYDDDYYGTAALHLTVYWIQHYKSYVWDPKQGIFRNPLGAEPQVNREAQLFELLLSKNDSVALAAYRALAVGDPEQVPQLARTAGSDLQRDHNRVIGTFPDKFLQVLPVMAHYCRTHDVAIELRPQLAALCQPLFKSHTHQATMAVEAALLAELTVADITAFEFWGLTHESSWYAGRSAGRILDKFYSYHWQEIVNDPFQLELYLRKTIWFDKLGIIGYNRSYLNKFILLPPSTIAKLQALKTDDATLQAKIRDAIAFVQSPPKQEEDEYDEDDEDWPAKPSPENDLTMTFHRTLRMPETEKDKRKYRIDDLFANISYDQIPEALELLTQTPDEYLWRPESRYDFLEVDFGLYVGNLNDAAYRKAFAQQVASLTEYAVYARSLDSLGFDYKKPDGSLDHAKIYEIFSFDIAPAFVGGGGGSDEAGVYALVKLLELTFKTRLGFPEKLCWYGA